MTHLVDEFYSIVAKTPGTPDGMLIVPVPEPGTWMLLLTGLVALGGIALFRRRQGAGGGA